MSWITYGTHKSRLHFFWRTSLVPSSHTTQWKSACYRSKMGQWEILWGKCHLRWKTFAHLFDVAIDGEMIYFNWKRRHQNRFIRAIFSRTSIQEDIHFNPQFLKCWDLYSFNQNPIELIPSWQNTRGRGNPDLPQRSLLSPLIIQTSLCMEGWQPTIHGSTEVMTHALKISVSIKLSFLCHQSRGILLALTDQDIWEALSSKLRQHLWKIALWLMATRLQQLE